MVCSFLDIDWFQGPDFNLSTNFLKRLNLDKDLTFKPISLVVLVFCVDTTKDQVAYYSAMLLGRKGIFRCA